jgi:hypothetical protein
MATGLLLSNMNQPSIDANNQYPVVEKSQPSLRFSLSEEKPLLECKFTNPLNNLIDPLYNSSSACCVLHLASLTFP